MGKILVLILIFALVTILWALPLYICVNFVLWVFNIAFHLTLLQAFAICLLLTVIRELLFKKKGEK